MKLVSKALEDNDMCNFCILVNGTAQSAQPITSIANQSAAAVAACAAAAATGCPGTPSPVTHTEPLSATAAAVFAATGIHPAAYAGGEKFLNVQHIFGDIMKGEL